MRNRKKNLGYIFILIAVVILVNLPDIAYSKIDSNGMDSSLYNQKTIMSFIKYIILSIFSFVLGIRFVSKEIWLFTCF